jgi:hypothetical protein
VHFGFALPLAFFEGLPAILLSFFGGQMEELSSLVQGKQCANGGDPDVAHIRNQMKARM